MYHSTEMSIDEEEIKYVEEKAISCSVRNCKTMLPMENFLTINHFRDLATTEENIVADY